MSVVVVDHLLTNVVVVVAAAPPVADGGNDAVARFAPADAPGTGHAVVTALDCATTPAHTIRDRTRRTLIKPPHG